MRPSKKKFLVLCCGSNLKPCTWEAHAVPLSCVPGRLTLLFHDVEEAPFLNPLFPSLRVCQLTLSRWKQEIRSLLYWRHIIVYYWYNLLLLYSLTLISGRGTPGTGQTWWPEDDSQESVLPFWVTAIRLASKYDLLSQLAGHHLLFVFLKIYSCLCVCLWAYARIKYQIPCSWSYG